MIQFRPAVRRRLPRMQRHDQHARQPQTEPAKAGQRDTDGAEQEPECHSQTDGNVTELGGAFDRVAKEVAQRREIRAVGENPDSVPELEHEVLTREEIGIAATDLHDDGSAVSGKVEIPQHPPHHRRPGGEYPQVVEVPAVFRNPAQRRLAEHDLDFLEPGPRGTNGQQHITFGEHNIRRRRLIAVLATYRRDLHVRREHTHQFGQRAAKVGGLSQHDFKQFHAGPGRHFNPRLEEQETEIEQQNGSSHPERIGD